MSLRCFFLVLLISPITHNKSLARFTSARIWRNTPNQEPNNNLTTASTATDTASRWMRQFPRTSYNELNGHSTASMTKVENVETGAKSVQSAILMSVDGGSQIGGTIGP